MRADRNMRKEEGGHRKMAVFFKQKLIGLVGYSDFEFLMSPGQAKAYNG